jgi:hypothetical protein
LFGEKWQIKTTIWVLEMLVVFGCIIVSRPVQSVGKDIYNIAIIIWHVQFKFMSAMSGLLSINFLTQTVFLSLSMLCVYACMHIFYSNCTDSVIIANDTSNTRFSWYLKQVGIFSTDKALLAKSLLTL